MGIDGEERKCESLDHRKRQDTKISRSRHEICDDMILGQIRRARAEVSPPEVERDAGGHWTGKEGFAGRTHDGRHQVRPNTFSPRARALTATREAARRPKGTSATSAGSPRGAVSGSGHGCVCVVCGVWRSRIWGKEGVLRASALRRCGEAKPGTFARLNLPAKVLVRLLRLPANATKGPALPHKPTTSRPTQPRPHCTRPPHLLTAGSYDAMATTDAAHQQSANGAPPASSRSSVSGNANGNTNPDQALFQCGDCKRSYTRVDHLARHVRSRKSQLACIT